MGMSYVYKEPKSFDFEDIDGHSGKFFGTSSKHTNHLIINCETHLSVWYTQTKVEFSYYILDGSGYFLVDNDKLEVDQGSLVVLPPGTKYTFSGKLKMLLINTQPWNEAQQIVEPRDVTA